MLSMTIKSTWAMRGFKAPERRRVLYIDGEMPLQIMQERAPRCDGMGNRQREQSFTHATRG